MGKGGYATMVIQETSYFLSVQPRLDSFQVVSNFGGSLGVADDIGDGGVVIGSDLGDGVEKLLSLGYRPFTINQSCAERMGVE